MDEKIFQLFEGLINLRNECITARNANLSQIDNSNSPEDIKFKSKSVVYNRLVAQLDSLVQIFEQPSIPENKEDEDREDS